MAKTTFSGPVQSDNGFIGAVSGNVNAQVASATVLRSASATLTNLLCTSLTVGSTKIGTVINAASGNVSAQTGYIQVLVGATTAYIALYKSLTV